jgi:hypothetical protein
MALIKIVKGICLIVCGLVLLIANMFLWEFLFNVVVCGFAFLYSKFVAFV